MRIAVIGTGNVGATLGRRWARGGHQVTFGTRRPEDDEIRSLVAAAGSTARADLPAEAAAAAEVVVLAVPGAAAVETVSGLGDLAGKILVDCTNPIAPGLAGLAVGPDDSGGEGVARAAPGARVVKAFNTTGSRNMEDPVYPGGRLAMFLCGDDPDARDTVATLATELGFEAVDVGPLKSSRYLEPLAMLWITMAYPLKHGPDFGFAVIRRGG